MKNDPEIFSKYDETFKKQQNLGIVKQVEIPGKIWQTHYLSPHGIIYEYKDTTKLSIIFDATSKTCNVSLNYCLLKRPSLHLWYSIIILRLRLFMTAIIVDIDKAFWQVGIKETDRD